MRILKPRLRQSLREIERQLRNLEWENSAYTLQLPRTIHLESEWLEFSFLQYLLTVRDSSPDSTLVLSEQHPDPLRNVLESTRSWPGRLAVSFSRNITGAESRRDLTAERFSAMSAFDKANPPAPGELPVKGRSATLLCFDAAGANSNPWLYPSIAGAVLPWGPDVFANLTREIILQLLQHFPTPGTLLLPTSREVGHVIYELFLNTHDWGRHRLDDSIIANSVRGVSFTLLGKLPSADTLPIALRTYVSRLTATPPSELRFLVIGVIDGGVGLPARFAGRHFTSTETKSEFATVLQCFEKHATATGREGRGIGLTSVVALLRALRAFVRIRTGRLHLYQDFSRTADASASDSPLNLYDWNTLSPSISSSAQVTGTLYEIFIPLRGSH